MKVTDTERAIFRMTPAEFNAYLATVVEEQEAIENEYES